MAHKALKVGDQQEVTKKDLKDHLGQYLIDESSDRTYLSSKTAYGNLLCKADAFRALTEDDSVILVRDEDTVPSKNGNVIRPAKARYRIAIP